MSLYRIPLAKYEDNLSNDNEKVEINADFNCQAEFSEVDDNDNLSNDFCDNYLDKNLKAIEKESRFGEYN